GSGRARPELGSGLPALLEVHDQEVAEFLEGLRFISLSDRGVVVEYAFDHARSENLHIADRREADDLRVHLLKTLRPSLDFNLVGLGHACLCNMMADGGGRRIC